ncbi:DUF6069 family protein [Nocardiopsis sp. CNT312]|uniref:DUF6069 family protein n=1 Tax=Nocardiopsis sp. CNT312 TaxID=1137268 RepID=UPI00048DEC99|nr:DUF6069 family protein [Nocardiopsis sp. CNT312]
MGESEHERPVNAVRLWSGGLATAVVAALVVLAGTVVARGVLGIPVLAPEEAGHLGDTGTAVYAFTAAAAALLATALLHLLLVTAPRPRAFFGWMIGLITAVAVVTPFTQAAGAAAQFATAFINLTAGVAIATLLSGVAATAVVRSGPRPKPVLRHEGVLPDVERPEYREDPRRI